MHPISPQPAAPRVPILFSALARGGEARSAVAAFWLCQKSSSFLHPSLPAGFYNRLLPSPGLLDTEKGERAGGVGQQLGVDASGEFGRESGSRAALGTRSLFCTHKPAPAWGWVMLFLVQSG